MLETLHD